MIEQAAHLALGIGDHRFVVDAVNPTRQHRVDMVHQRDVIGVIAAHFGEIVRERLPAREMLLEVGKAAGERMAARIDDRGIGQDQVDQRHVQPVVGHLVDEQRAARPAMDAGAFEVFGSHRRQLRGVQREQAGRIVVAIRAGVMASDGANVRQFLRAFDSGMR